MLDSGGLTPAAPAGPATAPGTGERPTDAPGTGEGPTRPSVLARHGAAMARHARWVTLVAAALVVGGFLVAGLGVGGSSLFSRLAVSDTSVEGEALTGSELLAEGDPSGSSVRASWRGLDVREARTQAALSRLHDTLVAVPGVATVIDPTTVGSLAIGEGGYSALFVTGLDPGLEDEELDAAVVAVEDVLMRAEAWVPNSQMLISAQSRLIDTITGQVEKDLRKGEAISLPVSLLIMVLIFGGFAAAGIPLVGALASIAGGLVTLLGFTYVMDLDVTVVNVVSVLGLGLCIDYSLLIVSRYREHLAQLWELPGTVPDPKGVAVPVGAASATWDPISAPPPADAPPADAPPADAPPADGPPADVPSAGVTPDTTGPVDPIRHRPHVPQEVRLEAMARTMSTAGRTVIFSGVTVAVAVAGLLLVNSPIIRSVGAGAVSVVVIAVVVATTLVPALLVLGTGHVAGRGMLTRVRPLRRITGALEEAAHDEGGFSRWARRVQRRPWLSFGAATAVLVVLCLPALGLSLVSSGVGLLPPGNEERIAYEHLQQTYPLLDAADVVVVSHDQDADALADLGRQVTTLPGVLGVADVRTHGEVARLDVTTEPGQASAVAREIREIRPAQPQTWVTGQAALLVDFTDQLRHDAPRALAFVVAATLVLLFLLTGSIVIPIKALVMNLLSLGATFGILVLVFQDGRFERSLNFGSAGGIEAMLPIIIFAFAFGLSMDYEVFLIARIKEFHDQGHENDEAVRLGIQHTGRIITSAALLIVVVFSGFVLADLLAVKETGVALATAVLVDATIVRMILVPSAMTLLGGRNWWAPGPLRRLHDRLGLTHG